MKENKKAYKHDFSGNCAPIKGHGNYMATFSVGIFQWLPKARGKGLKKSAVKYRVRGGVSNSEAIYDRARTLCKHFDYQTARNPAFQMKTKSETVR